MAAPKKKAAQGSKVTRRTTGTKQGGARRSTGGTKTGQGQAPKKAPVDAAAEEQKEALEPVTLIAGRGGFQLRAGGPKPDGSYEQPWELTFGKRGFIAADDETVDAVQKVLDGEWTDGSVGGRDFQRNASIARLQIIRHGLESPPIPAWDNLGSDSRVEIALEAGVLRTPAAIKKAIRYEKQSGDRTPKRAPDETTLGMLEALLGAQQAGVRVAGVDAGAAASAGGGGLLAGAQELG